MKSVEDFCTAWHEGMCRVWSLPINTKSDAVYLVADVISIFDELCKRVLNFVSSCYRSDSDLVRFVVKHGMDAHMNSLLGRNVMFCSQCLFTICAICHYQTHFREHFSVCLSAEFVHRVHCAFELIMIHENILSVSGEQLTTEDCMVYQSTVDLILGSAYLLLLGFTITMVKTIVFVIIIRAAPHVRLRID